MSFKIPRPEISRRHSEDRINNEPFYFFGKTGSQEKCSSSQQTNSSLFSREEFEDSFSQSQSDDVIYVIIIHLKKLKSQCFWTSLRRIWKHEDILEENQEPKPPLENAAALQRSFGSLLTELQETSREAENTIKNLELSKHFRKDEENTEQICKLEQEILQYAKSIQTFNETFQMKTQNCQNVSNITSHNFSSKYLKEITNAHMKLRTVIEEISENFVGLRSQYPRRQLMESLEQWRYNDFQLTPILSKYIKFRKSGCNENQTPFSTAELYPMRKCTSSSIKNNPLLSERKKVRVSSVKMMFNRTPLTEQRRNNLRSVFSRSLLRTVPFVKPQPKSVKLSPARSTWIDLSDGWNQKSIGQMFSISSPSSSSNSSECLSFSSVSEI
ncbi:hypothetical protein PHET_02928 [Paragonimus heterotremus]|uniref:Uncharacterized protein n=1 Tax=Paragonimus heterotremus TaxID=100268 RepID=A0A8J4TFB4_9TREM|nr:hypothetical protein PHET_02928 [Paragonimus heterotremus]